MLKSLNTISMESVMSLILKKIGLKRTEKLLRLYDFNNLKAQTFYQILETSNLLLIMSEELPDKQLVKVKNLAEQIQGRWFEILETYYKRTDLESFENFLSEQSYNIEQYNEMLIIQACEILMNAGIETYKEHLSQIGIEGTNDQIKSAITQIKAKYEVDKENQSAKNKKSANNDYYALLGIASESLGYHIPSNILLAEWCGIMAILKRKSEAQTKKE